VRQASISRHANDRAPTEDASAVEAARAPMRRAAASIVMAPLALTGEVVGRLRPDPPDLKEVSRAQAG